MSRRRDPAGWARPTLRGVVLACGFSTASADDFDRLEGPALAALPASREARPRKSISSVEMGSLPSPFRETRAAVLVVKTAEGNLARLMVSSALRKPARGPAVPVIVLERFETFESPGERKRLAKGGSILLFDGFRFDLDGGQVVPEGQGGDLRVSARGEVASLSSEDGASIFSLENYTPPKPAGAAGPSPGRAVKPGDFEGNYHLVANGQWSGSLALSVADPTNLKGRFRSEQTGNSYKVTGFLAPEEPNLVHFAVELPMARLEFDGRLWTMGKGAMAGSATLQNRSFGFVALRDGARLSPELEDSASWFGPIPDSPGRRDVTLLDSGKYRYDGREIDPPGLIEALVAAVAAEKGSWVSLKVPPTTPFATLAAAVAAIRSSGVADVRLSPVVEAR